MFGEVTFSLKENSGLKPTLTQIFSGSLKDIKPPNWCLTEDCNKYLAKPNDDTDWAPEQEYYIKLIGRLVDNILLYTSMKYSI